MVFLNLKHKSCLLVKVKNDSNLNLEEIVSVFYYSRRYDTRFLMFTTIDDLLKHCCERNL